MQFVRFLGHVVLKSGISCDPEKISAVSNWPAASSIKDVRQFLGTRIILSRVCQIFYQNCGPTVPFDEVSKTVLLEW